jgi:lipoyl(octanoyl) transferase
MVGTVPVSPSHSINVHRPGVVEYRAAWRWQDETAAAVAAGGPECLALLEHPPVYTLGRRASREHLLVDEAELERRGAGVVETDRGGDVTFHGPGQLVGYPILNLRARGLLPGDYVRALESVLLDALAFFGIDAGRVAGRPGAWTDAGKLASIGVRVRAGVTTHGFALNVATDLSWFDAIVPCGLFDARMTSMAEALGGPPATAEVEDAVARRFARTFGVALRDASTSFEPKGAGVGR